MHGDGQRHAPTNKMGGGVNHLLVTVYSRPWWNWFRKTSEIRCWECDLVIKEAGTNPSETIRQLIRDWTNNKETKDDR